MGYFARSRYLNYSPLFFLFFFPFLSFFYLILFFLIIFFLFLFLLKIFEDFPEKFLYTGKSWYNYAHQEMTSRKFIDRIHGMTHRQFYCCCIVGEIPKQRITSFMHFEYFILCVVRSTYSVNLITSNYVLWAHWRHLLLFLLISS